MKPHKFAKEIHAWANGEIVQYCDHRHMIDWIEFTSKYNSPNFDAEGILWRIKPPGVTQWRKDLAEAKKTGKVVQRFWFGEWASCKYSEADFLNGDLEIHTSSNYRVKPEPKPDVITYCAIPLARGLTYFGFAMCDKQDDIDNLKLIWDGETGRLKGSEVLK